MNDTPELDLLAQHLRRRFIAVRSSTTLAQTDPALLARLDAVGQALAAPRGRFSTARIAQGIMAFRIHGSATVYPELKYACYGIARPMDWEGRILLGEAQQMQQLLEAVGRLPPRQRAACCRGLRHSWQNDLAGQPERLAEAHFQTGIAALQQFLQAQPAA
ncbi:MAG: hypothetical protein D3M94_03595 [Rhodocyclales bacterium GT-UBC]|nr:MAG: hypothetical protein D3M94_03595 [Rhodocyclales bacterium GT-UBC]